MLLFVFLAALVGLAVSRFRRCLLMLPVSLVALLGGWVADDALWKATGGTYGECTDVCFPPHEPGSASALFMPLWTTTAVLIVVIVLGILVLLVRSSPKRRERAVELSDFR